MVAWRRPQTGHTERVKARRAQGTPDAPTAKLFFPSMNTRVCIFSAGSSTRYEVLSHSQHSKLCLGRTMLHLLRQIGGFITLGPECTLTLRSSARGTMHAEREHPPRGQGRPFRVVPRGRCCWGSSTYSSTNSEPGTKARKHCWAFPLCRQTAIVHVSALHPRGAPDLSPPP